MRVHDGSHARNSMADHPVVLAMTPIQQRFCDNARKLYQALYNAPYPFPDRHILRIAQYLRIRNLSDPEDVTILLDAMHSE